MIPDVADYDSGVPRELTFHAPISLGYRIAKQPIVLRLSSVDASLLGRVPQSH
jgi:hypothetical protein